MAGDLVPSPESLISVGVIRKAHGVRGEASVEPLTRSAERFRELVNVFLHSPQGDQIRPATIESVRIHGNRALIKFREFGSPEEIREIQEWTIAVRDSDAIELEENEYFIHDLEGLRVLEDETGRYVGEVESADENAGGVLLTVRRPDGGRFELPFASSLCTSVDLVTRQMTVNLPEGLEHLGDLEPVDEDDDNDSPEASPLASNLRVDIVTIFPHMFDSFLAEGIVARALRGDSLKVRIWDLREFTSDKHKSTDDEAYGGGVGMVMLAEPVFRCLEAIRTTDETRQPHVVLLSPQGRLFRQETARELAGQKWIVLLCGRYEGFDERIREALVNEELSIGDFVVSGGELPAMLVLDATSRMVAGVVGDRNSVEADSFYNGLLDHPHYTRPAELRGMRVPDVLLSGHAENIRKWRKKEALRATRAKRPDLLHGAALDAEAQEMLASIAADDVVVDVNDQKSRSGDKARLRNRSK